MERTFIMIKPDGVSRGLVADVLRRFEQKGFKLVGAKMMMAGEELLRTHYGHLAGKPFFPGIVSFMRSGPVFCMVWEGRGAVKAGRLILGQTNPLESLPGTVRGDYAVDIGRNICHGSDSVDGAAKEIALWFPEGLISWDRPLECCIYE